MRTTAAVICVAATVSCGGNGSVEARLRQACQVIVNAAGLAEERDEQFALKQITDACKAEEKSALDLRVQLGTVCQKTHEIWITAAARKRTIATASKDALLRANDIACADASDELYSIARNSAVRPAQSTPPATETEHFEPIAAEFRQRLGRYSGTLERLENANGKLKARWTSGNCAMVEGEVIDLLLSINRGYPSRLRQDIEGERTCGGAVRRFALSAARFQQYRTGQANDADVLIDRSTWNGPHPRAISQANWRVIGSIVCTAVNKGLR